MVSSPELAFAVTGLVLAGIVATVVFRMARALRTGIFVRFFQLLRVTVVISLIGRSLAFLQVNGWYTTVFRSDLITAIAFLTFLTASFVALYVDWQRTPLTVPIRVVPS